MLTAYQLIPSTLGLVTFAPCISNAFYSLGTESECSERTLCPITRCGNQDGTQARASGYPPLASFLD